MGEKNERWKEWNGSLTICYFSLLVWVMWRLFDCGTWLCYYLKLFYVVGGGGVGLLECPMYSTAMIYVLNCKEAETGPTLNKHTSYLWNVEVEKKVLCSELIHRFRPVTSSPAAEGDGDQCGSTSKCFMLKLTSVQCFLKVSSFGFGKHSEIRAVKPLTNKAFCFLKSQLCASRTMPRGKHLAFQLMWQNRV